MTIAMAETSSPSISTVQPWPGLDAFKEEFSQFFCGRDLETVEMFRHVQRDIVTVLFGQSGLGKTSLLQAGLFPRLRKAGFLPISLRVDYSPEAAPPLAQVKAAIERECAAANVSNAITSTGGDSLWVCFHRIDRRLADSTGTEVVPVLVLDQFEEIFTQGLAGKETRPASQQFLTELAELVENRPPEQLKQAVEADPELIYDFAFDRRDYRVVLALREDFLAGLESLRSRAPSLGRNRYRLRRMTGTQGLDVILNPAPGLVDYDVAQEIIRFVGRASPEFTVGTAAAGDAAEGFEVEPSLLSLVCRELNERRITRGLDEIGADLLADSREEIIEDFYERCLAGQPEVLRAFVEDELLSASGFRESVTWDKAQRALKDNGVPVMALEELVRRRLLRIEERSDVARVEIIHDVLTPIIRKSRETSRREAALHRERRRRLRAYWVAAAIALMSLATTGLLYWGWSSKLEAERQRSLVEAQQAANADLQQANADLRAQVQRLENALSKVQPGSPQADLTSVRSSGWGLFEWTVIAALVTCGGAVGAAAAILSVRVLAAPGAARAVYQRGTQFHQEKTVAGPHKTVLQQLRGGNGMDASHVATGAITALLATVLVYLSHWPLQPFDLPTASAFAGLIVALGGGLVKFYKAWTASASRPVIPSVPLSPAEETAWEARRTASVAQ